MSNSIRVTYFDTAMVLLEVDGVRLLTDPVLDPKGSEFDHGSYTLEKTNPTSVGPEELGRIDAVLLSHDQHADNLDQGGRALLAGVPRVLTTPEGAERLGGAAEGLSDWQSVTVKGASGGQIMVTAVPAQHGPDGTQEATGAVTGFIVTTGDRKTIYISGDTVPFAGTEEIASRYAPVDVAILHLGRVRVAEFGDIPFSMEADQGIDYAQSLGAHKVVPIHHEGWAHFTEQRDAAMEAVAGSAIADRTIWLRNGEAAVIE